MRSLSSGAAYFGGTRFSGLLSQRCWLSFLLALRQSGLEQYFWRLALRGSGRNNSLQCLHFFFILSQEPSGRAFLQKRFDSGRSVLKRSHFFETLKSKRRLKLCREVSLSLYEKIKTNNRQADPFDRFSLLDGYDIYAGDCHYHAAAVHDFKKAGKKYPTPYDFMHISNAVFAAMLFIALT